MGLKDKFIFVGVGIILMGFVVAGLMWLGLLPGHQGMLIMTGAGVVIGLGLSAALRYYIQTQGGETSQRDQKQDANTSSFWEKVLGYLAVVVVTCAFVAFFSGALGFGGLKVFVVAGFAPSMAVKIYGEVSSWVQAISYFGVAISVLSVASFLLGYITFNGVEIIAVAGCVPLFLSRAYQSVTEKQ